MNIKNVLQALFAIFISELAGIIGALYTTPAITTWYATLNKPEINPPSWVFGPVWTTLFALMGVAAFLVWKKGLKHKNVKIALAVFVGQLVLNTLWSYIFFGLHNPGAAFVEIIALWLSIATTIYLFSKISRSAAWLMAPYIAWVSFAAYLNFTLFILN